jgi:hypothetical protein
LLQDTLQNSYVAQAIINLLVLGAFAKKKWNGSSEQQMHLILKPYILEEIKEIIIPDGIGGLLEIEHLVLTDRGLLLIETYPMAGNLFGAETIDQWTQIIDGRSYKFANPLRHIRTSRQAIKALTSKPPVFCRIIFNSNSIFPKGKPDEVSVLNSLSEDMAVINSSPVVAVEAKQSWDKIMRIARKNGQAVLREGGLDG